MNGERGKVECAYLLTNSFLFTQSAPTCTCEMNFVDLDTGETITVVDHDECTFITRQLMIKRHYNITIHASNGAGSATSYTTISKLC